MWCSEPLVARRVLETNKKTAGSDIKTSRYYYYPPYAFGVEYFGQQNNVLICRDRNTNVQSTKEGYSLLEACKAFIKDLLKDGIEYVIIQSDTEGIASRRCFFCSHLLGLQPLPIVSSLKVQNANVKAYVVKL
jgi:hypothetical protein